MRRAGFCGGYVLEARGWRLEAGTEENHECVALQGTGCSSDLARVKARDMVRGGFSRAWRPVLPPETAIIADLRPWGGRLSQRARQTGIEQSARSARNDGEG